MVITDWIVIGLIVLFAILGMLFGFGKGLKFFTGGIFGIIISVFVCYALGGLIYNISFVHKGLESFRAVLERNGSKFCNFLLMIRIETIVYYVVLFVAVTFIRILIVKIIKSIVEIDNMFLIVLNKILGVVFYVAVLVLLILFVFWIIALIKGPNLSDFPSLAGSKFKLGWLYENNPFMTIIKVIWIKVPANA